MLENKNFRKEGKIKNKKKERICIYKNQTRNSENEQRYYKK